ncbi:MAG: RraA family protein [Spirochaetaceae bacterium]|jgi:regulator of RNase E activity RraA|nr:RraA family protein [Spirochaetaceae bacterium]
MKYLPYDLSYEELCFFTPQWTGDRFPDGRPKVPDAVLDGILKYASITHAWGVCREAGYHHQFLDGFQSTIPGEAMVGRALTALYLPILPGLREQMTKAGQKRGEIGDMISWPIQRLIPRDVYVADVFGKTTDGPIVGERLSTAIYAKSRNGCVHNAAVRDIDGILDIKGFNIFHRGMHPSHASPMTIMLGGINCPMRMEGVTVMPGDVVLAKNDCVIFIPAHLAEYCSFSGMIVSFRDQFAMLRCREGVYTSGEIDGAWPEHIEKDFLDWITRQPDVPFTPDDIERIKGQRLW